MGVVCVVCVCVWVGGWVGWEGEREGREGGKGTRTDGRTMRRNWGLPSSGLVGLRIEICIYMYTCEEVHTNKRKIKTYTRPPTPTQSTECVCVHTLLPIVFALCAFTVPFKQCKCTIDASTRLSVN